MDDAITVADRVYARVEILESRVQRLVYELENNVSPGRVSAIFTIIGDIKEDLVILRKILLKDEDFGRR